MNIFKRKLTKINITFIRIFIIHSLNLPPAFLFPISMLDLLIFFLPLLLLLLLTYALTSILSNSAFSKASFSASKI